MAIKKNWIPRAMASREAPADESEVEELADDDADEGADDAEVAEVADDDISFREW